jgi:hypothetical protein
VGAFIGLYFAILAAYGTTGEEEDVTAVQQTPAQRNGKLCGVQNNRF